MAHEFVALAVTALASIGVGTAIPLAYRLLSFVAETVAHRTGGPSQFE